MSKFNQSTQALKTTVNHAGAVAYQMSDKEKLVTQVMTSFFNEKKFYGENSREIVETIQKVIAQDAKFAANLCVYLRNEMHLRSLSHVMAGELAKSIQGKPYVKKALCKIVERPDDMTEILSYYLGTYGKPIPNAMKKGLSEAFSRFDEYQLAKYNRDASIKLKDILCMMHPKPMDDLQSHLWKKLLEDRLETPVTWETQLSARGNKKEVWEDLIAKNQLGYMAMMRNLRNILKSGVSNIDKVYETLTKEERVLKNKQLPFRYYSAYKVLKQEGLGTSKVFDALECAIEISTRNITRLKGKTMISADVSGSMNSPISAKSDLTCAEIAVLMMSIANFICEDSITTTFDTKLRMCSLSTRNGIIANASSIKVNGGGTNINLPIQYLIDKKIFVDRMIILSDNEINYGYTGSYYGRTKTCQALVEEYRKKINPDVWVHAIDMQGYGTQQFIGHRVNLIAGWNEKVLDFMGLAEAGVSTLTDHIANYCF